MGDPHVFIPLHRGVEIEVFDVYRHELGSFCRDDIVEQDFYGGEGCSLGRYIKRVVNSVSTHGKANTSCLHLLGAVITDNMQVVELDRGQ
jgi:hypothetical protein